jgi:hypothetical protein
MGSIILTGISHGKHQFLLTYPEVEGVIICMAHCRCGYEVEIVNFRNYVLTILNIEKDIGFKDLDELISE